MPVEPGLVDTNVLVYALDADAPQHASSRALLEAGRAALVILYVTSQIICEFYCVVTNPRHVAKPCSAAAALGAISSLLGFLRVLPVPAHTVEELIRLVPSSTSDRRRHLRFADPRHHERERHSADLHVQHR